MVLCSAESWGSTGDFQGFGKRIPVITKSVNILYTSVVQAIYNINIFTATATTHTNCILTDAFTETLKYPSDLIYWALSSSIARKEIFTSHNMQTLKHKFNEQFIINYYAALNSECMETKQRSLLLTAYRGNITLATGPPVLSNIQPLMTRHDSLDRKQRITPAHPFMVTLSDGR